MADNAANTDRPQGGAKRRWRRAEPAVTAEGRCEVGGVTALATGSGEAPAPPPPTAFVASGAAGFTVAAGRRGLDRGRGPGIVGHGGREGSLGLADAFNAGARQAYLERYAADLRRLEDRSDLPASSRWFDSHCHLESIIQRTWRGGGKPQVTDREPVVGLAELIASWPPGLEGCICNCVFRRASKPGFPPEWAWLETNLIFFEPSHPLSTKLWFTVGIHPHDADNWDIAAERMVRKWAAHPKCVGIGECGLDFFKHDRSQADKQVQVFRAQAALAVELGKALVVHARLVTLANESLFLSVLEESVPKDHPIHMHCYSDSLEAARQLIERWPRLRIGFTGSITFRDPPRKAGGKSAKAKGKGGVVENKGEEHCRALVQGLPLERLLVETDGPYMCPEPFRGQTSHSGHVHRVAERIAEWQGRPLGEVMQATRESTRSVYGI